MILQRGVRFAHVRRRGRRRSQPLEKIHRPHRQGVERWMESVFGTPRTSRFQI